MLKANSMSKKRLSKISENGEKKKELEAQLKLSLLLNFQS